MDFQSRAYRRAAHDVEILQRYYELFLRLNQLADHSPLIHQIEDREQQGRSVWPLARTALVAAQIVEPFNAVLPCLP